MNHTSILADWLNSTRQFRRQYNALPDDGKKNLVRMFRKHVKFSTKYGSPLDPAWLRETLHDLSKGVEF